jgi:hypothetical protein
MRALARLVLAAEPPPGAVAASFAVSLILTTVSSIGGFPIWVVALGMLVPWLPLAMLLAHRLSRQYGWFALLAVVAVLQVGHLGEHIAQVTQLYVTNGSVRLSHGVFGQLDVETVHFIWETSTWLVVALLLVKMRPPQRWLWVAFAVISLHTVEHLYMFSAYAFDQNLYTAGAANGIFAKGGLLGLPLARPYLHLLYNYAVTLPLVLALCAEADRILATAVPRGWAAVGIGPGPAV